MRDRRSTWPIPAVFIIAVGIVIFFLTYKSGPDEEDYARYEKLKKEVFSIEKLSEKIDSIEAETTSLREKLEGKIRKRDKKTLETKLDELISQASDSRHLFDARVNEYEKEKFLLPKELADSLKIFRR